MNRFLTKLFSRSPSRPTIRPTAKRTTRLSLEGLEDRYCPSTIGVEAALQTEITQGIQTAVNALQTQLANGATQLAIDCIVKEYYSPTIYAGWGSSNGIVPDASRLYNDAQNHFGSVATDLHKLGQDLSFEANLVQTYLPGYNSESLTLSSSQVVSDFNTVSTDLAVNEVFALINTYYSLSQSQTSPFQMSSAATTAIDSSLTQATSPYATPSGSEALPLGSYPNATGMGLAFSTGTGGDLMNQYFGSALGVNSGTLSATLTDSGALTPFQINNELSPYLGMSQSNFLSSMTQSTGIGALISAGGATGLPM